MRAFTILTLVCAAVFANAADDFDLKVSNIDVLRDKNVQTELGITEGQRKTMNVFADKFTSENKAKVLEYQKAKKQPDKAFQDFGLKQYITLRTSVLKTLSPNQVKRLRELTLQAAGPRALLDKTVADKVGIPTAEYNKFRTAISEGDGKIAQIKKAVADKLEKKYSSEKKPASQKEADALRARFNKDLTAEMKKKEGEMSAVLKASEAKTGSIITKKYLDALAALMGKRFVPPKPAPAKKPGK
jgi:hypothetical protein